jgi:hypothetical protein
MGYINGPLTGVASNASALTLTAPQGVAEFVAFFESNTSGADATVAITCLPVGGTVAQMVVSNVAVNSSGNSPYKIDGLQVQAFTFTPALLTSGASLTTILQPIVR